MCLYVIFLTSLSLAKIKVTSAEFLAPNVLSEKRPD